jgi:predicted PhzF superfamily epimerase YddE/YHI9
LAAQLLDNGPVWLGLLLDSPDTVLALDPDHARAQGLWDKKWALPASIGLRMRFKLISRSSREARAFAGHDAPATLAEPDLVVRAFAAPIGVNEDPVTGSLNASLAQWLIADGHLPEALSGRPGRVPGACRTGAHRARCFDGQVWVGGESVTCITGTVTL